MDKILLDTTYFLPVFGVSVRLKDFDKAYGKLLDSYSAIYNPASLIEAKWVLLKLARLNPGRREALLTAYRAGLKALASDGRLKQTPLTNARVEGVADQLLASGMKDYFDRLIFATAADQGCVLLTEDEALAGLRRREKPRPSKVMTWKDVLEA